MTRDDILELETEDYQHRRGNYPKSDVADSIRVEEQSYGIFEIEADFKNTSEDSAKRWLERFVEKHDLTIVKAAEACQDGDYQNDWVRAWVVVKI